MRAETEDKPLEGFDYDDAQMQVKPLDEGASTQNSAIEYDVDEQDLAQVLEGVEDIEDYGETEFEGTVVQSTVCGDTQVPTQSTIAAPKLNNVEAE